jgi:hypothetical protein
MSYHYEPIFFEEPTYNEIIGLKVPEFYDYGAYEKFEINAILKGEGHV